MCSRYQLVRPRLLAQVYGVEQRRLEELQLAPNVNVRPTQRVPVPLGEHELALLRWGFVPSWAKDNRGAMIDARAEGIAEQPMSPRTFRTQRCAIPASGCYVWQAAPSGGRTTRAAMAVVLADASALRA